MPDRFSAEEIVVEETATAVLEEEQPEGDSEAPITEPGFVAQIPDSLWSLIEEEVRIFLDEELSSAEAERAPFIEKLARWKEAYRAPLPDGPKNFPIMNSSNLTVPVIKEIVNTISAQLVQITMTAEPRWVLKDLADEWDAFAPLIERFLDIASRRDLRMDQAAVPWIIECCKYGTSIAEVDYEVEERKTFRYAADGVTAYPKRVVVQDGPTLIHIPLDKCWYRLYEDDIQRSKWFAKELTLNETELRDKAAMGKFDASVVQEILKLEGRSEAEVSEVERVDEEAEETKPIRRRDHQVFELYLRWDVPEPEKGKDGSLEEVRLYYHRDSGKFLRKEFLPFWHGKRPFAKIGFFPVEGRFLDEGLIEMLETLQKAISNKHNQRADNATMANLKMFVKRRLLKSFRPGDPLYTGKIIEVNDIWNDLRELQMAEIYPSTVSEEQILRGYAERLVGHGEASAGGARPVSRTTATAELALLQEQARRLDLAVRNIRGGLNEVGRLTMNLYFQFGTSGKALAWMGERGRVVEAVFRMPKRVVELGVALDTNTPTSTQNRQVQRENSIALFNLMVQLYERLIPLVAQISPEAIGEVTHAMVTSAKKFMSDTLAAFEVSDPEDVLAGLTVLQRVLPNPEDLGGVEDFIRREESAALFDKLSRVESLLSEAEESGRRRTGVRPSSDRSRDLPRGPGAFTGGTAGLGIDRETLGGLGGE